MSLQIKINPGNPVEEGMSFEEMRQHPGVYEGTRPGYKSIRFIVTNCKKVFFVEDNRFESACSSWKLPIHKFRKSNSQIVFGNVE